MHLKNISQTPHYVLMWIWTNYLFRDALSLIFCWALGTRQCIVTYIKTVQTLRSMDVFFMAIWSSVLNRSCKVHFRHDCGKEIYWASSVMSKFHTVTSIGMTDGCYTNKGKVWADTFMDTSVWPDFNTFNYTGRSQVLLWPMLIFRLFDKAFKSHCWFPNQAGWYT